MALLQQDGVYVAVVLRVGVTQQELQRVTVVTVEDSHQRAVAAQALEGGSGHSAPVALQGEQTTHTYIQVSRMHPIMCQSRRGKLSQLTVVFLYVYPFIKRRFVL